jgi:hypothetical protein
MYLTNYNIQRLKKVRYSSGRALMDFLNSKAELEELEADFQSKEFVARMGRAFKIVFLVLMAISVVLGIILFFMVEEWLGSMFFVIGFCGLLVLPSILTWRCTINRELIIEECLILFFKYKKVIAWNDIKYQKLVINDTQKDIVFYNKDKKRLISFDNGIVGFAKIVKLAKRKGIEKYKK